ncbi:MAG: heavy metal-binding domain-containing protein [Solirubrobacteraceae bacterium]
MGFFNRRDDRDGDEATSLERVESGGIPLGAERRLRELGAEGSLFTSGLSVNEFALLRRMGPQPLAQVMGASVIRTGWQYLPPLPPGEIVTQMAGRAGYFTSQSPGYVNQFTEPSISQIRSYRWHATEVCELDVLTDAWTTARRRALDRLCEEALRVNADAVVGVHLHRGAHDLSQGTIEYVLSGTAVRVPGSTGTNWPVVTDLSVQDYWRLHEAGHDPVGFLATTAVMFASPPVSLRIQRLRTIRRNQELDELSQAFRIARETVRTRIEGQVSDAHGAGAVGVTLSHSIHRDKLALGSSLQTAPYRGWNRGRLGLPYYVSGRGDAERRGWVITMHAAGTAIRPRSGPSQFSVKPTVRMGIT